MTTRDVEDLAARASVESMRIHNPTTVGGAYESTALLLADLVRALRELGAERERLKYGYAPHMCRDGHQEIRHFDSEHEMCPLCQATAERDSLKAEVERLESAFRHEVIASQHYMAERDALIAELHRCFTILPVVDTDDRKAWDCRNLAPHLMPVVDEYEVLVRQRDALREELERYRVLYSVFPVDPTDPDHE